MKTRTLTIITILLLTMPYIYSQGFDVYNEAYMKAYQMIQSGYCDPAVVKEIWDSVGKQVDKQVNRQVQAATDMLNTNIYNQNLESGDKYYNKGNYIGALYYYKGAVEFKETVAIYNKIACAQFNLGEYDDALISFSKALKLDENSSQVKSNLECLLAVMKEKRNAPIKIQNIEIGNLNRGGDIETDFGRTIYSSSTMYLAPMIHYKDAVAGKISLKVKIYREDGSLSAGTSSPEGYSYEEEIKVSSKGSCRLPGWGGEKKGHWESGEYRWEIWYKDCCLAVTNIKIEFGGNAPVFNGNNAGVVYPVYAPYPTTGSASGGMKMVRETCSYCRGTGKNPSATSVPGFGSSQQHYCSDCNSMVSASHGAHLSCPSCKGRGYNERYR